jgi:hypothetical protein
VREGDRYYRKGVVVFHVSFVLTPTRAKRHRVRRVDTQIGLANDVHIAQNMVDALNAKHVADTMANARAAAAKRRASA